jgi:hypothetical protein
MQIQIHLLLFITILLNINATNINMVIEVDRNKFFVNKPKDGNPDYFYAPIWMHKFNNQHFYFFIEEHNLMQIDSIALENVLQNKLSNAFLVKKTNFCFEGENGEKFGLKNAREKCFSKVKNAQKTMKDIQQGFPISTCVFPLFIANLVFWNLINLIIKNIKFTF